MSTEPVKVPILADSSDKNNILTNTGAGFFTVASGFGIRLAQDLFPKREDFNGLFNAISKPISWFCKGGFFVWDSAIASGGGYPIRAIVKKLDNSGYWSNTIDNNTTNPDAGGANWVDFSPIPTNAAKWDAMPVGACQPFLPWLFGSDIATWLAAHPTWEKLDNSLFYDIEGRVMAVASGSHAAGSQAGSDDSVVVSHTHSITDPGHNHTFQHVGGTDNDVAFGTGYLVDELVNTGASTTGISINSTGVSGTNANIQRTQYFDWIVKVA